MLRKLCNITLASMVTLSTHVVADDIASNGHWGGELKFGGAIYDQVGIWAFKIPADAILKADGLYKEIDDSVLDGDNRVWTYKDWEEDILFFIGEMTETVISPDEMMGIQVSINGEPVDFYSIEPVESRLIDALGESGEIGSLQLSFTKNMARSSRDDVGNSTYLSAYKKNVLADSVWNLPSIYKNDFWGYTENPQPYAEFIDGSIG